ncbi:MAG TPA: molybdenum cofactor biosynthesis protein MoaE [Thiotrichaceae bacterium]|jgi:molybdopterin synthase catalytic subunit|nr:molybdenum cofactor biosynthesis protein MoaE [Thiotrichaceae bacterium]HIM06982.1 molybdenum cofactor biosynthesis protein MoaE [Gammaproteobacteria bacterium]
MLIEIRKEAFNAYAEMQYYLDELDIDGQYGATASFVGTMRDFNEDKNITSLTLEYYPGMTEKHLETIVNGAIEKWNLLDVLILHRVGKIKIAEDIVLVATWSAHRKDAFESCRVIMEQLKSGAPFWKKEETTTGVKWVEKNTPGF